MELLLQLQNPHYLVKPFKGLLLGQFFWRPEILITHLSGGNISDSNNAFCVIKGMFSTKVCNAVVWWKVWLAKTSVGFSFKTPLLDLFSTVFTIFSGFCLQPLLAWLLLILSDGYKVPQCLHPCQRFWNWIGTFYWIEKYNSKIWRKNHYLHTLETRNQKIEGKNTILKLWIEKLETTAYLEILSLNGL